MILKETARQPTYITCSRLCQVSFKMPVPPNPLLRESAQPHTLCLWAQPGSVPPQRGTRGKHLSQWQSKAKWTFVRPKTYVTRIKVFRWGGPMRFLYQYLELESWETHFVMWTTTNRMTQVQGKPSGIRIVWGNRDWNTSKQRKVMVEEGPRAGKSRNRMLPGGRDQREPWAILLPAIPDLHVLTGNSSLFATNTHKYWIYNIPLVTQGTSWHLPGGASGWSMKAHFSFHPQLNGVSRFL